MLTTEPVHLAPWCDDDERKDGLLVRFTDAFAGRWPVYPAWVLVFGDLGGDSRRIGDYLCGMAGRHELVVRAHFAEVISN